MENMFIISDINKKDRIIDEAYFYFREMFLDREKRPRINDKFIYLDERTFQSKEHSFWHISSIGEDDTKFDSFPCNNDVMSSECAYKCDSEHEENYLKSLRSIPCVYRANRIPILLNMISLYNSGNTSEIKSWIQHKKGDSYKSLMIRYQNSIADYVSIFRIVRDKSSGALKSYQLVTAYPVVLKSYKRRFDREYKEFRAKK